MKSTRNKYNVDFVIKVIELVRKWLREKNTFMIVNVEWDNNVLPF